MSSKNQPKRITKIHHVFHGEFVQTYTVLQDFNTRNIDSPPKSGYRDTPINKKETLSFKSSGLSPLNYVLNEIQPSRKKWNDK